jgi:hypothetical protein
MIERIIPRLVDRFGFEGTVAISILSGFVLFPVIEKVYNVSLNVFTKMIKFFSDKTFMIRFRSLFCSDCAERHKLHIEFNRNTDNRNSVLVFEPVIVQPPPYEKSLKE